ncbi:MAG: hypothetical protein JSW58_16055 [Candidatus Latescibacterota bacterium]|nr:MAG: hypothetical protein JSW58_16055 [Candidatus Latescibacterota bacterium]
MKTTESAVTELAFIFKFLPLFQEVETIDRVYRLLLGIVTSGRSIGYRRAMIFTPDEEDCVIRGRYGAERPISIESGGETAPRFEKLAKELFRNYENIDGNDLTLKARSYSVPLLWHRSALVKAVRTGYPVLAERGHSEFASDTFFDFFGTTSYVAMPIEFEGRVMAVLAADRGGVKRQRPVDDISVLFSLVQQAAASAQHLTDSSSNRRKSRILSKLHRSLHDASTASALEDGLKAGLAMLCRAVGGSVCIVKDLTRQKTHVVEVIQDYASEAREHFKKVAEGFDDILDLSAGTSESVSGDREHPQLRGMAAERVEFFFACPLLLGNDIFGALVVYVDKDDNPTNSKDFKKGDRGFLELCAGLIASGIQSLRQNERLRRTGDCLDEVSSHLARERERSRIGDRSAEYQTRITEDIEHLERVLKDDAPVASRLLKVSEVIESMAEYTSSYRGEVLKEKTRYKITDLFKLTRHTLDEWRPHAEKKGIELTVRIPEKGPSLLLDRESITTALENILRTTASFLSEGEKMLVECSCSGERALVCVADNGRGLPGDALSRLLMPFADVGNKDKDKRALSVAGEVLQKHSGEIMIKSSFSWKTILVLGFPVAASRDRRKSKRDRRRRRERRTVSQTT